MGSRRNREVGLEMPSRAGKLLDINITEVEFEEVEGSFVVSMKFEIPTRHYEAVREASSNSGGCRFFLGKPEDGYLASDYRNSRGYIDEQHRMRAPSPRGTHPRPRRRGETYRIEETE